MTDIDFIKQKNKSTSAKTSQAKYGVEYTNPHKSHRSLKEWFKGFGTKRKHIAAAVPPPAPQPGVHVGNKSLSSVAVTAQPHAKPEAAVVPAAPLDSRSVTTMPVAKSTSVSATAGTLAPALAPLTRAAVVAAATQAQPIQLRSMPVLPNIPPPTAASKFKISPVISVTPASGLVMPADKTMLLKVQPGTQQAGVSPVTALRVIPTPPIPPTPPKPLLAKVTQVRVLPKVPTAPLQGLPATIKQENKVKTVVAATTKTHAQVEVNTNEIQVHNVSEYSGATTNPQRPAETALHINLIPQLNTVLTPLLGKVQYIVNTLLFSGIVIVVGYLGIIGYQSYYFIRTNSTVTKISALEDQILTYRSLQDQVHATAEQLTTMNALLSEHRYWTNIFALLEEYTLPNVYYTVVNADASGVVTLQASTSDYASVSHQIEVFKRADRFIQQVNVVTATGGSNSTTTGIPASSLVSGTADVITFNITLQIKPEVLQYHYDGYFKN